MQPRAHWGILFRILLSLMFFIQLDKAVKDLLDPKLVLASNSVDIEEGQFDLPLILMCPLNQYNKTKLKVSMKILLKLYLLRYVTYFLSYKRLDKWKNKNLKVHKEGELRVKGQRIMLNDLWNQRT